MAKDIFKKPFDEGTKQKLEIFKGYIEEWIPTFTRRKSIIWKDIEIYDFFSGEGQDENGIAGSPLIILQELKNYHEHIKEKGINVKVILNEKNKSKYEKLQKNIEPLLEENPCTIVTQKRDFKNYFDEIYPGMLETSDKPRLIFIDQNGIKQVTENIFKRLSSLKRTDFIFFISSSILNRFKDSPEFTEYIKISNEQFERSRPYHCHRVVFNYYKSLLTSKNYYLAPYSLKKKGGNIYGLIFGSNHQLGIEKFLTIAWKLSKNTGDANFNIDEEDFIETQQYSMFESNKPKKVDLFEHELEKSICRNSISSNKEMYQFSFDHGFLPKHANAVYKKLIDEKKVKPIKTDNRNIHKLSLEKIILLT